MKKSKNNIVLVVLGIICIFLVGGVIFTMVSSNGKDVADSEAEAPQNDSQEGRSDLTNGAIEIDGKVYKRNKDIHSMLFMGVDKTKQADLGATPGQNGQTDSLNLLIYNEKEKTAQIFQISRDSMVDIDIYDEQGDKLSTERGQICLQYAYGDGKELSCRLTVGKVSELLYRTEIESYLSLTIEGMKVAADVMGGIPVTFPDDYTDIDPAFQKGATVVLDGTLTEKLVRSRDTEQLDSNQNRMARQAAFMDALIDKISQDQSTMDSVQIYNAIQPYLITNMTADELFALSKYSINPDIQQTEGNIILKDDHAQFIPDKDSLQNFIIKTFYLSE